ncbi:MAG: S8 family serine peptidase [Clostridia bacterium]|nr:S8 family serine peptidase [Clostridia bacterium]
MKKSISVFLIFVYIIGLLSVNSFAETSTTAVEEYQEIIVKFKEGTTAEAPVALFMTEDGESPLEVVRSIETRSGNVELIKVSEYVSTEEVLSYYDEDPNVEFAEPNYKLYADSTQNDPLFNEQWALKNSGQRIESSTGISGMDIQAASAWKESWFDEEGVIVAVIDGGIQYDHPDLLDAMFVNTAEIAGNSLDDDGNGFVDDVRGWDFVLETNDPIDDSEKSEEDSSVGALDKHGTHVAGIIGAASNGVGVQGVAPKAKILPLKIMNDGVGTVYDAIQAIQYADAMGVHIVNCSWSLPNYSAALEDAMQKSNMLFVCSAGNNGNDLSQVKRYPSSFGLSNVISVAFMNNKGVLDTRSNYGENVDIVAPGTDIISTIPNDDYGYLSGSSMAAPFVTGVAALVKGHENNISAQEIKQRILSSATLADSLTDKVKCGGFLNAANALCVPVIPNGDNHTKAYAATAETMANKMYRVGGYTEDGYLNTISEYNVYTNEWTSKTPMSSSRANHASAVVGSKLYVFGGMNSTGVLTGAEAYNSKTDQWEVLEAVPVGITGATAVAAGNNIYLFGGVVNGDYVKTIYEYNISDDSWSVKGNLPAPVGFMAGALAKDGKVYLFGGCNNEKCLKQVLCYDPEENTTTVVGNMPEPKRNAYALAMQDKIYVVGGQNDVLVDGEDRVIKNSTSSAQSMSNSAFEYDIVNNSWSSLLDLDVYASGAATVYYQNELYYLGGWMGEILDQTASYKGFNVPQNISVVMQNDKIRVSWDSLPGATHYYVEQDGVVSEQLSTTYKEYPYSGAGVHAFRVRAEKDGKKYAWSKVVSNHESEQMSDAIDISDIDSYSRAFSNEFDTHWYKIQKDHLGTLNLKLINIPENCEYQIALCDYSGVILALGQNDNGEMTIDNFSIEPYTYYIRVFPTSGVNAEQEYTLSYEFEEVYSDEIPERVYADLLMPDSYEMTGESVQLNSIEDYPDADFNVGSEQVKEDSVVLSINSDVSDYDETFPYVKEILEARAAEAIATVSEDTVVANSTSELSYLEYDSFYVTNSSSSTYHDLGINGATSFLQELQENPNLRGKIVVSLASSDEADEFLCAPASSSLMGGNGYTVLNSAFYDYGNNAKSLSVLVEGANAVTVPQFAISVRCSGEYTLKVTLLYNSSGAEDYAVLNDSRENSVSTGELTTISFDANNYAVQVGKLDHALDVDFFKVTLNAGDKLSLRLQTPDGVSDLYSPQIFNTEKQVISTSWKASNKNSMQTEAIAENTGTYYVVVYPSKIFNASNHLDKYDESFSPAKNYTLKLYKSPQGTYESFEVNDWFEVNESESLLINSIGSHEKKATVIRSSIDSPGDKDIYPVQMKAGDKLSVQLRNKQDNDQGEYRISILEDLDKDVDEYNRGYVNFQQKTFDNPFNAKNNYTKYVTFIAPDTETFYVQVHSADDRYYNASFGKGYELLITHVPKNELDAYESHGEYSNDFRGNLAKISETEGQDPQYGFIDTSVLVEDGVCSNLSLDNQLDIDWYKIEIPEANGAVVKKVTLESSDSELLRLLVHDISGNTIATQSGETWMAQPGGIYYFAVYSSSSNYSSKITYTMRIEDTTQKIASVQYNGGVAPKMGTNTLKIELNGLEVGKQYECQISFSWQGGKAPATIKEVVVPESETKSLCKNIEIEDFGDGLMTIVDLKLNGEAIGYKTISSFVTNNKINFTPVGGGKYFYISNKEWITERDLADNPNGYTQDEVNEEALAQLYSTDEYLNEIGAPIIPRLLYQQNLDTDNYELFAFFHNGLHMNGAIDMYKDLEEKPFVDDIFVNIQFFNHTDQDVTINFERFGYQIPSNKEEAPYNCKSYACLNAFSDYYQLPFYKSNYIGDGKEVDNYADYYCSDTLPLRLIDDGDGVEGITLESGESFWLFDINETQKGNTKYAVPNIYGNKSNYSRADLIQILTQFSVKGSVQMNVMAYKDFSNVNGVAQAGYYYHDTWDSTIKGMANSLAEVETELAFELDSSLKFDDKPKTENKEKYMSLPVVVQNQFYDAKQAWSWLTNINAQSDDIRGRNNSDGTPLRTDILTSPTPDRADESGMLELIYSDGLKLFHYTESAPNVEREENWIFNTKRSDTTWQGNQRAGAEYVDQGPNFILEVPNAPYQFENTNVACSMANYGVRYRYKISINNKGGKRKVFYDVATISHIIGIDNLSKEVKIKGDVKNDKNEEVFHNLFEFDLPANRISEFDITVILPTGDPGRIANRIIVKEVNENE